ncbi:MAG: hypothetical protein ACK564_05300 [Novosphingobium sp.]
MLRRRRTVEAYDHLIGAAARISASPDLEGLRLKFVWTLADAIRGTTKWATEYPAEPRLKEAQLRAGKAAMERLYDHPMVAADSPDAPEKGIRGPAGRALKWTDKALAYYAKV